MPDGSDKTSTMSTVNMDSEFILGGHSNIHAAITYGDKDGVVSANSEPPIFHPKPISQNVSIMYIEE